MARKSRQGVLKRQRERKKAEKAELKRGERTQQKTVEPSEGTQVASEEDLAGYGLTPDIEPEQESG